MAVAGPLANPIQALHFLRFYFHFSFSFLSFFFFFFLIKIYYNLFLLLGESQCHVSVLFCCPALCWSVLLLAGVLFSKGIPTCPLPEPSSNTFILPLFQPFSSLQDLGDFIISGTGFFDHLSFGFGPSSLLPCH